MSERGRRSKSNHWKEDEKARSVRADQVTSSPSRRTRRKVRESKPFLEGPARYLYSSHYLYRAPAHPLHNFELSITPFTSQNFDAPRIAERLSLRLLPRHNVGCSQSSCFSTRTVQIRPL